VNRLYRPLFDELQRRGAVVFIHPTMSPDPSAHRLGLNDSLLDFPVDTARTVAQMHYKGVFAATRDVKYVVSHARRRCALSRAPVRRHR